MTDDDLRRRLLDRLAARRGYFRLESGRHADTWLDLDLLFRRPADLRPVVGDLAGRLAVVGVVAVCDPLVGGALVAQTGAGELDLDFAFAERIVGPPTGVTYRIPAGLRPTLRGKAVAVVDDAISGGSAVRATLAEVEPRTVVVKGVSFGRAATARVIGAGQQDIALGDGSDVGGVTNFIQPDRLFVFDCNRQAGDNFQVYFPDQAADAVVPQLTYNTVGLVKAIEITACSVASLGVTDASDLA